MFKAIEKAYYFDKNEYLLLLGLGGIHEVYSFCLPQQCDVDKETLAASLHRLVKRGCMEIQGKPVICPAMEIILDGIRMADRALHVVPGKEGTQKICYLWDGGVVVTELAGERGDVRISSMSYKDFWEILQEGTGLPVMPLLTEAEGLLLRSYHEIVSREYTELSERMFSSLEEPAIRCIKEEGVTAVWEIVDLNSHIPVKRILFIRGFMNDWVQVQTGSRTELCFDSLEFRGKLNLMLESEDGI